MEVSPTMSVTSRTTDFTGSAAYPFIEQHPHLAPFLLAVAIFLVTGAVALLVTGLPG